MVLLLTLDPASFPQVSHSRVKCDFHKFFKIPTVPAVDSKKYARTNMFGIINTLGAFQENWLKKITHSEFHLRASPLSSSTYRVPKYILLDFLDGTS